MPTQSVTLNIPDGLYQHLKQRADQARRTVEEETLDVLSTALPGDVSLPQDLAESLESLKLLDDATLWKTARSRLAGEVSKELEVLHHKQQRDGLTDVERQHLAALTNQYERHMLVRAQAAVLLKKRGHDVSELGQP